MNGQEHDVLTEIHNEIRHTREEIRQVSLQAIETKTDVKNLVRTVDNINEKLDNWSTNGCPIGKTHYETLKERQKEQEDKINKLQNDTKDIEKTKKQSVLLGSGGGAISGSIVQLFIAFIQHLGKMFS